MASLRGMCAFAVVLGAALLPAGSAASDAWPGDCACGKQFSGHFTGTTRSDQVLICARPAQPDASACRKGFSHERFFDTRWTLFARRDGQARFHALHDISATLNRYDYVRLVESCRDPDTRLDQLLFAAAYDGSGNGNLRDAVFVQYDVTGKQYTVHTLGAEYVGNDCSLQNALRRQAGRAALRRAGATLHDSLRSATQGQGPFRFRALPSLNPNNVRELFAGWNRRLALHATWKGAVGGVYAKPRFVTKTLAENARWRVVSVYYLESAHTSWGVLLTYDKKRKQWFSFYDVPAGSDKRFLFLPENIRLRGDLLHLDICTDCEGWGTYRPFSLNLAAATHKPLQVDAGAPPVVTQIIERIRALSERFPELKEMHVSRNEDGLPTLRFSHGLVKAPVDGNPMKKGGNVPQLQPDGFSFSLLFYRGEWQGAAVFRPIRLGSVNLWYRKRLGSAAGVQAREVIRRVDDIVRAAEMTSLVWENKF